jgi:glycosyltransferase involved in cell wall biosynthesis
MRLLYLYPEEWTGRRAREVHTLATCRALAEQGIEVTLLVAGGKAKVSGAARTGSSPQIRVAELSRAVGPIRSAHIFDYRFRSWLGQQRPAFDAAFTIHLKGASMLQRAGIPYAYEAHEIFSEGNEKLHDLEESALGRARWRIATSSSLAEALQKEFALPHDFLIAPNAGDPPLPAAISGADGPFVYAGSIADWKGLDLIVAAAREAKLRLRIIGGTEDEWRRFSASNDVGAVEWIPRVPVADLPAALSGARAGLIATQPDTPSGRYSCPMKLFDYARCGLPVITTALPSLGSLEVGAWCVPVGTPQVAAWRAALENFRWQPALAAGALAWSAAHTWAERGRQIARHLTPA